ncbi:hypothetical protein L1889_18205 [Paenalcaligenes niemegkensis]|uniref:hypothetical protein n=1 Tax=Paenalcaligenes niemegkensis TaxID=2895469 RepID=UPI001EE9A55F|nr:hypothetical protein [Paenalcaligenes niemegkensis]MCQ9618373.1 hypothetical protein [Paenalcaligenes niemegkensis]
MTRKYPNNKPHLLLDRWIAELAVDEWLSAEKVAEVVGVSGHCVLPAIRRVYGCGVIQVRAQRQVA